MSACTLAMCFERQRRGATIEGQMRASVHASRSGQSRWHVSTVETKDTGTMQGWFLCALCATASISCELCVRRSGVLGCRVENFACVTLCLLLFLNPLNVVRIPEQGEAEYTQKEQPTRRRTPTDPMSK